MIEKIVDLLKPKEKDGVDAVVEVSEFAPLSFKGKWNLLPVEAIKSFVFAPLPYEIRILANKFKEFGNTLQNVGVHKLTDMDKLSGITFKIPGLAGRDEKIIGNLGTGKISLMKGLPVANFPLSFKKDLPAEFVFARMSGELVDLDVALSISEKGNVSQKISSLPGKTIRLVVKPISSARSVIGYFIFKSPTPRVFQSELPRENYSVASLFSLGNLVEASSPIPVEQKLVLSSFKYEDLDHDGIYTADVITPSVPGEYEIITVIEYIDPTLGVRQMRMINVVDPEGYVFEKNKGKETRIGEALVSLYYLNFSTKNYELWPSSDFQQENPQITDIRGTYSFLVPEGSYYLKVEALGYKPYEGNVFVVREGSGVHQNIELKPNWDWRGLLERVDIETALLVVVLLLLLYNLYYSSKLKKKTIG